MTASLISMVSPRSASAIGADLLGALADALALLAAGRAAEGRKRVADAATLVEPYRVAVAQEAFLSAYAAAIADATRAQVAGTIAAVQAAAAVAKAAQQPPDQGNAGGDGAVGS